LEENVLCIPGYFAEQRKSMNIVDVASKPFASSKGGEQDDNNESGDDDIAEHQ